ncbi:SpoIIE family protein phosphatase [Leptospira sp. 2 VSF19]|uniref:SpoIIE family protein phosphatase n=1 Tax=Leptospira soteropolitanensis TaxID=2950025 RepID=A0AAW5VED6_9LEPT|nr:7TM diverse intracellular signaling domain-containing protein [Leptospira soteropolitanensis]MCW7491211.1 SpoIIE family protein phosphatase [Leptospira soteropolitanensis]MCW7498795.1 SpoIIE family protein phosphatase [Leptospira soteropolitanensis]MCW7521612.1 SpoIIE family protein phosphatase [Leptospira soteropolitanensis]MCW7524899.1 SpoIIE family protein phosphatase [Leptospira soteropolitanensis]MCW7528766.1 SpoIIE family protein phosphatase [Leptospira soteropolitanensis]
MKQTITFILLCLFHTNVFADSKTCPKTTPIALSSFDSKTFDLSPHLTYFSTTPSIHSLSEVNYHFQTFPTESSEGIIPNFGNTDKQYWFCFVIHNDENDYKRIITYIKYPLLDEVRFIALRESGEISENIQGRLYPFRNRERDYRGFSYGTDLLPSETVTYFVGVKTDSSMSVPLMVAEEKDFDSFVSLDTLLQGFYFGIVGVMTLYNLFVYFMVRDKAYIYYVLYLFLSAILFQFSMQGLFPTLFFPSSPEIVYQIHNPLYFLFLISCFPLSITFMNLKENAPIIYKWFLALSIIPIICLILLPFLPYRLMNMAGDIFSFLLAFFALLVSFYIAYIKKFPPARFYFFGFFFVIVGGLATVLRYMGFVPVNVFTENAFQIGTAIEVLLMAFGLGDRISVVRKEKDKIQLKAEINKQKLIAYGKELKLAQKLQESTLPQILPKFPGLIIKTGYFPASLVGGDFYDLTVYGKHQICGLIADVTGHGVPAAIEAAMLKIAYMQTLAFANKPGKVLESINVSLVGNYKNQLLTASAIFIDLESKQLKVANAGHPALYKFNEESSSIEVIRPKGKLIGYSKEVQYPEETYNLNTGDKIFLFTDGIWDLWENGDSGEEELLQWLLSRKAESAESLYGGIDEHIRLRNKEGSADDDITFILFEIT